MKLLFFKRILFNLKWNETKSQGSWKIVDIETEYSVLPSVV